MIPPVLNVRRGAGAGLPQPRVRRKNTGDTEGFPMWTEARRPSVLRVSLARGLDGWGGHSRAEAKGEIDR